jgi:quercetin dioxygenase-like cupin family protein
MQDVQGQEAAMVVGPGDGRVVRHPSGAVITVKVHADDTGGTYSLLETTLPAGGRVPPHIHHHEDEATYVLDGELSIEVGAATVKAETGSYVVVPRDVAQSFINPGDGPCRFLTVFTPGGGERFFEEAEELARASEGAPPPAQIAALHARYALEYL